MLKEMTETEPFKRQADSEAEPGLDEESRLGPVEEQRVPRSLRQFPSTTLRSGAFARLLATRGADGAEVHAAIEEVRGEVDERIGRGLGPVVAMIEARFDRQGAKLDRLVEAAVEHNAKLEMLTKAVTATNASIGAPDASIATTYASIDTTYDSIATTYARIDAQYAKIEALIAKVNALKWMFGILIALLVLLAAAAAFNFFSRPGVATSNSSSRTVPSAVAAEPSQPPPKAAGSGALAEPAAISTPTPDEFASESRTAR